VGLVYIQDFLKEIQKSYQLYPENTILLGFSQGSIMALHTLYYSPDLIS
jgi:predicted esterase